MKKIEIKGNRKFFKGLLSNTKPMVEKEDEALCVMLGTKEDVKELRMKLGLNDVAYSLIKERVADSNGGLSLTEIKEV